LRRQRFRDGIGIGEEGMQAKESCGSTVRFGRPEGPANQSR
jgi:hypothetical protein